MEDVLHDLITPASQGRSNILLALAVSAILLVGTALLAPHAAEPIRGPAGYTLALTGMTLLVDLLTAVLLLGQAHIAGDRGMFRIGTAFLFAATMTLAYLLVVPDAFFPGHVLGGYGSATWIWCGWHVGFPLLVARFALVRARAPAQPIRLLPAVVGTVAATLLALLVATSGLHLLPDVIHGSSYARLNVLGIGPAITGLNAVATVLVLLRLRGGGPITLWLAVATLAATIDAGMALGGGARYVVGWYTGRVAALLTGLIMLLTLLAEMLKLYRTMQRTNVKLRDLASTDSLTLLGNRRSFDSELAREWRRARREGTDLGLLLLDIDHFKRFNDSYGHPAGDLCLQRVASAVRTALMRPADVAFRYGGEELAVILPATSIVAAYQIAERVRECIVALDMAHASTPAGHVTVSIGAATIRPRFDLLPPEALVLHADEALYTAKRAGRNTTCSARGRSAAPSRSVVSV